MQAFTGIACQLSVELRQTWLPIIIEDQHSINHPRVLRLLVTATATSHV